MKRVPVPRSAAAACAALALLAPAALPRTTGADASPAVARERAVQDRPSSSTGRFFLAVLRGDGVMVPFASFNGRRWATPWPANIGGGRMGGPADIPMNLAAIPDDWWDGEAPSRWRLFTGASAPMKAVTPVAPLTLIVGVMRRLGLRTDHPPTRLPPDPRELPFPKEGLLVGGDADLDIRTITPVSRSASDWQSLPSTILQDINKAEERTLGSINANTGWRHPFDRATRSKLPPALEAWYVTSVDDQGTVVSFVELVKKYPLTPEDKGCGLETFVSGWVHHADRAANGRRKTKTSLSAVVTYCDRAKVSYMLPFAQIRVRDRTHWVFQMSGRDHEWYTVAEATADRVRVVAEYDAGGVPAWMAGR